MSDRICTEEPDRRKLLVAAVALERAPGRPAIASNGMSPGSRLERNKDERNGPCAAIALCIPCDMFAIDDHGTESTANAEEDSVPVSLEHGIAGSNDMSRMTPFRFAASILPSVSITRRPSTLKLQHDASSASSLPPVARTSESIWSRAAPLSMDHTRSLGFGMNDL